MIAIINTGERDALGAYRYRLQINDVLVATFTHYRADGLGACLRLAAAAADRAHAEKVDRLLAVAEWVERPGKGGGDA